MSVGRVILERRAKELIEAIKPMAELGADNRRIADTLNKRRLFTPQSNKVWTAYLIDLFCKRHAKELSLDDGESLFQNGKRPRHIEDFFPYPNYGPMP